MIKISNKLKLVSVVLVFVFLNGATLPGQSPIDSLKTLINSAADDSNKVNQLLELSQAYLGSNPEEAVAIGRKANNLGIQVNYLKGSAYALKYIGIAYYYQGNYIEALEAWQEALLVFDSINDKTGVANILSNIGAIYYNEGDYNNALNHYLRSLSASEELKDTLRILTALSNIGAVYNDNSLTHDKSLTYSLRALELSEKIQAKDAIATSSVNIGEIYLERKDYDKALAYFEKSLEAMEAADGKVYTMVSVAKVYTKKGDFETAFKYLDEALVIAQKLNALPNQAHIYVAMASTYLQMSKIDKSLQAYRKAASIARSLNSLKDLEKTYAGMKGIYSQQGRYDSAYKYQSLLTVVEDSLYNIEVDKLLSNQMFNFQIEKKQNEINLLKANDELKDQDIVKQKTIRNLVIAGFFSVIIFLIIAVNQKKNLKKAKERSENLLLNILPMEIAEELKESGKSDARDFDQVTVLFTDFKEFTGAAQEMTAKELVEEINYYFEAFDNIVTKYKIEKIKTIGDAYMAAGGIPVPSEDSVKNVVLAALEMQRFVHERQEAHIDKYSSLFNMRAGIHTGPVVAGIVGVKKFQYDMWGDTVNTASRMESSGDVGKINISHTTFLAIKDEPEFTFEYRGEIEAKGKGKLKMYFVQLAQV